MYVWDEYSGEAKLVTDACPGESNWNPETSDMMRDSNLDEKPEWEMTDVIDFPNGTRLVIEVDSRASTCVWMTTKEDLI